MCHRCGMSDSAKNDSTTGDGTERNDSAGTPAPQPGAGKDPRQTAHPTGEAQAAENAENESPA